MQRTNSHSSAGSGSTAATSQSFSGTSAGSRPDDAAGATDTADATELQGSLGGSVQVVDYLQLAVFFIQKMDKYKAYHERMHRKHSVNSMADVDDPSLWGPAAGRSPRRITFGPNIVGLE